MHRTPRLRPAARVLLLLAALLAFAALLAGPGAASTKDPVSPPFDQSDNFWAWPGAVLLHVGVTPAESSAGYVVSDPYYIDCPFACTRPYDVGAKVTLTAYPTNGFAFTGWVGDACAGQGNPCTLTMSADTVVTAAFSGHYVPIPPPTDLPGPNTVTLTVAVDGHGSPYRNFDTIVSTPAGISCGRDSNICSAPFPAGSNVSLNAFSLLDVLTGWSDGGGTVNPHEVTMTGNKSITANFVCPFPLCRSY